MMVQCFTQLRDQEICYIFLGANDFQIMHFLTIRLSHFSVASQLQICMRLSIAQKCLLLIDQVTTSTSGKLLASNHKFVAAILLGRGEERDGEGGRVKLDPISQATPFTQNLSWPMQDWVEGEMFVSTRLHGSSSR